jgi:hypothetical protein
VKKARSRTQGCFSLPAWLFRHSHCVGHKNIVGSSSWLVALRAFLFQGLLFLLGIPDSLAARTNNLYQIKALFELVGSFLRLL